MYRPPPGTTLTDTLFPDTTLFRSGLDRAEFAAPQLRQIRGDFAPQGDAAVLQPRIGEAGMATRGLQRLVRGLLRMPLRLQPGPCLVAWRQGEVESLAATADGGRQARGIGNDQPQVAPGLDRKRVGSGKSVSVRVDLGS